ncbi:MAG: ammonium transporter [Anaerolineales bacterium]|nr:ammonium transporter [Anaerolineales bacterium]
MDTGDTTWVLISSALVLVMTPALGFFYGGMVRKKNILSTLNLSFIMMALLSIQWILYGYTLAFGNDIAGLIGGLNFLGLNGVGADPNPDYAATVPHMAFMAFQMMFAIITPALITGAFVERVRFKSFLLFSLLWATLIYDPVAHWVWGGGILGAIGALDFAGGAVVHITAGFSALAFAMVIGARKGFGSYSFEPHNIPYSVLGAGLLWMGWFGFNGGSALAADGIAVNAVVTTNTAAAAAGLVWMFLSWRDNKPSVLGIVTGAVVGLVAVTPAAGFVTPLAALVIGATAAPVSYFTIKLVREKFGLDESLDVFACHGMGGLWGALMTGLFASSAVNSAGADGLLYGNPAQFGIQALSVVIMVLFSFSVTFALAKILDATIGLRVSEQEELVGLDISEHGEKAYA